MRKTLKITLSILAGLLLLGIVTLVTLPFMVDVNDFKAQIESAVQENTGRKLKIEGDVSVSIFPWLGITTEKMTLENGKGFSAQPFAQINEGQIKVKLVPLLFKQVEVSEVVLKDLSLNLLKTPQGLNNWDDLAVLIQNSPQQKNPLKLLEIAGILIQNAQIGWNNQQTSQKVDIKEFNLATDKLVFNQPVKLSFNFIANHSQQALTERLDFSGNLMINEAVDMFHVKKIRLRAQTEADFLPKRKLVSLLQGDAKFDLKQQTLKLAPLQIKTDTLTVSSTTLTAWFKESFKVAGSIHVPNFDAAEFIKQHRFMPLPQMADEKALTWLAADFHLEVNGNHAKLQNLEMLLDETTLKGFVQVSHFTDPEVDFNLALDTVNFDRYLAPPQPELKTFQAVDNKPPEKKQLLPLETLRKLNLNGQILIDELKVSNLTMQGIRLLFNAKNGQIQSTQSVDKLYQGAYTSRIGLDVNGDLPVLSLQQQLSHIQIAPLLTDLNGQSQFAGLIDLNAKLEARGNSNFALKSSLNGRLSFLVKDLLIRGFNLQKIVDNGKILLSSSPLTGENKKDQTAFSNATGTVIISNGILNNNDLFATAPKIKVGGMGAVNLVSQQLDYKIIAVLLKEKMIATHAKVINNLPVFINIGGIFDTPTYQVDLAAMGVGL